MLYLYHQQRGTQKQPRRTGVSKGKASTPGKVTLGNRIREIEARQKALEEQAEQIRQEIKADMETKQAEEMKADSLSHNFLALTS